MAKFSLRRILSQHVIQFAAGDIHRKYVGEESPFYSNPILSKGREAALKKTPRKAVYTHENVSAKAQQSIDTLKKLHDLEKHRLVENASPRAKVGLMLSKWKVPLSHDVEQALAHHHTQVSALKEDFDERINRAVEAEGGKVKRTWVNPGTKLSGTKLTPTLHPSFMNWAININEGKRHTDYLERRKLMKKGGEVEPWEGKAELTPGRSGRLIAKGSQSKLAKLDRDYRKEILAAGSQDVGGKGFNPWKGYKSELLGKRTKLRQAMAEELGYKFHPYTDPKTGKRKARLEVTGKRQIIQAQRRLAGTTQPMPKEFWEKLGKVPAKDAFREGVPFSESERRARQMMRETPAPSAPAPAGGREWKPTRPVGLAGAGPEHIEAYHEEMHRVETRLNDLVGQHVARQRKAADDLKAHLMAKTEANLKAYHPSIGAEELAGRRDLAVNTLLHGSLDPEKSTYINIEGAELKKHAGTIGIKVQHAKKVRTQWRNLLDTEANRKKIRTTILNSGEPFLETHVPHFPTGPKYPHLKKLGIGAGIGAAALGAGYLARRWYKNRQQPEEASMAAKLRLIEFAQRRQPTGGQRVIVTKDRYLKRIKHEDIANAVSNYIRSAGAGAGVGFLLKGKMPGYRAAKIGAAVGIGAEAVTRSVTARTKDPFGERPWQAKEVDKAPWEAGTALAGAIVAKRRAPRIWKAVTRFSAKEKEPTVSPLHDIATGGIEGGLGILATDRLIKRFAPKESKLGRKLLIGAGVGGLATGVVGGTLSGVHKILYKKKVDRKQMSSKTKVIEFAPLTEEEREQRAFDRRWSGKHLKARGEDIYTGTRRGYRFARDIKNTIQGKPDVDSRGRPRKKEWQKPWFFKKLALGGIGIALGGAALIKTEKGQGLLQTFRNTGPGKFLQGVRGDYREMMKNIGPKSFTQQLKERNISEAAKKKLEQEQRGQVRDILGMKSKLRTIQFDYWNGDSEHRPNWRVRDLSRHQAVVTSPTGRRHQRRQKRPWETKDFQQAAWGTGVIGALGAGYYGARRYLTKTSPPPSFPPTTPPAGPVAEQLHLPITVAKGAHWSPTGHLVPKFRLSARGRVIRFAEKKRDYVSPAAGVTAGAGGFVAGGLYRGRKLSTTEDLTGRRVTVPLQGGLLHHEGIGIGPNVIAQVYTNPKMLPKAMVTAVSKEQFAKEQLGKVGDIKVLDRKISQPAAERAAKHIGKVRPYTLLRQNCQRFGTCMRTGKLPPVTRQLRNALAVGGIAAGAVFGGSKVLRRNRNKEFSIQFRVKEEGGFEKGVRRTAEIGGLAALGLGLKTLPAASKMIRISAREQLARGQAKLSGTKVLSGIVPKPKLDPNKGGKLVYDYIDASQHYLNRGLTGKVSGAILRRGVEKPTSLVGRIANKMYPGHFGPSHFARFRAGYQEALGHWDYELGKALEHKGAERTMVRKHYGGQHAQSEIKSALYDKGLNEREALRHVSYHSTDPRTQEYFNLLAGSKAKAAAKYAKLSLISPGLIATGATTAAVGKFAGRKRND